MFDLVLKFLKTYTLYGRYIPSWVYRWYNIILIIFITVFVLISLLLYI